MTHLASSVWRSRWHGLSIALALQAIASPACADVAPPPIPAAALILFGAHWCAPCTGELHDLAELGAAVAALPPDLAGHTPQIVLAWIDRPLRIATTVLRNSQKIVVMPPAAAQALADLSQAQARGLPFTLVIDAHGRTCALHRGPLRAGMIAALWAACMYRS